MARRLTYWLAAMLVWLVLVWTLHYQELVAGAVAALITALVFGAGLPLRPVKLLDPRRWFWLVIYIPVFVYQCLKSNIDVALRVLSPGLQLRPGIVKIRTALKSDIARVFLANSITLTPGTMAVDIVGDVLYIHWIEVATADPKAAAHAIIGPFEFFLARIFD
ncbi:MAG: Na+/H+ antiporter subunit E [bacterium]|jgi:multicomponent Na+:H+ antiporter subunit E